MASADVRSSQIKRDRRQIIRTLKMIYAGWMHGDELFRIVLDSNPEYTRTLLVKDMNYLGEKGYTIFRGDSGIEAQTISVAHCEFKLTAAGCDVADRMVKDPTLDV